MVLYGVTLKAWAGRWLLKIRIGVIIYPQDGKWKGIVKERNNTGVISAEDGDSGGQGRKLS